MSKNDNLPVVLSPRIEHRFEEFQKTGHMALSEFWAEMEEEGTPIMEAASSGDSYVTFVWREGGTAQHVAVIQDWGCDGIREHHMSRLPGSDVWYRLALVITHSTLSAELFRPPSSKRIR